MATDRNVIEPCSCRRCQSMCEHRPCWPTKEEADALLAAGLGDRLMRVPFQKHGKDYSLLSPAVVGLEGKEVTGWERGPCTFYKNGLCEIHHMKPVEGRLAMHWMTDWRGPTMAALETWA